MKKKVRFFVFLFACLMLVLGVTPLFFVGRVSQIVETQCNKNLDASVKFNNLSLNLFRNFPQLTVTLSGLQVTGVDTFRQDTLVRAEKIRLVVNLFSILTKEGVTVKQVDLVKPRINCVVLGDGRANWNIMKPDTTKNAGGDTSVVHIALRKVTVKDARLVYRDKQSGMDVTIDRWFGTLKGNLSSRQSRVETSSLVNAFSFRYGGVSFVDKAHLDVDGVVNVDFEHSRYDLASNRIVLNNMPLSFKGFVQIPDTSTIRMDLMLDSKDLTFKQLLSLVPALYTNKFNTLNAAGNLQLSARAKGDWKGESYPAFNLKLSVKNGSFNYPDLPAAVTDMFVDVQMGHEPGSLDKTVLNVNRFHMAMAGQPVDATLHLATPLSDPAVDASLRGTINLATVKNFYPLGKGKDLKGTLKADMHVAGRLSSVEKKRFNEIKATGGASATAVRFKQEDGSLIRIDKAALTLTPAAVRLESLLLNWGRNDLQASGSLENYVLWFMNKGALTGNLNVSSTYLNLNDMMAKGTETAHAAKNKATTVKTDALPLTAADVPKNLDLTLRSNIKKLLFRKLVLENIDGTVRVKAGRVSLDNIKANSMGGTLGVNGFYTMLTPEHPLIDVSVNLQDVSYRQTATSFSMVRELAPVFEKIQGTYSMNLTLNAAMDNHYNPLLNKLSAHGRLQSSNLKLSGVKVLDLLATTLKQPSMSTWSPKNVDVAFTVNNGRIKTAPFTVKVQDFGFLFEGSSGIDKTLDYTVKATLPERFSALGASVVNGTITGTFDKPSITMDLASLARQTAKGVAEKMVKQLTGGTVEQQVGKAREAVEKQAAQVRAQARAAGDKLIAEAGKEGDKLIEKATNPVLKLAAKAAAERLKTKAKEQAAALEVAAEEKVKALYKEQGLN